MFGALATYWGLSSPHLISDNDDFMMMTCCACCLFRICTFLYLNYVVVMVYVQLHIPVALLWGICLWKEITQPVEIISLFVLTAILIGGMITTTYGVYGSIL